MKKITRRIGLITIASTIAVAVVSFSVVSAAKFVEGKKTDQSAYGLGGERKVSIFFNANVWTQGKDSSGEIVDASYYMYVWKHNGSLDTNKAILAPSAHVMPTVSGTAMDLYVFEYDATSLNRFLFVRWNPAVAPSIDLTAGKWNQTQDQTYSNDYNYYCIDDWGSGNPAEAVPTKNKIVKNGTTLSWLY